MQHQVTAAGGGFDKRGPMIRCFVSGGGEYAAILTVPGTSASTAKPSKLLDTAGDLLEAFEFMARQRGQFGTDTADIERRNAFGQALQAARALIAS